MERGFRLSVPLLPFSIYLQDELRISIRHLPCPPIGDREIRQGERMQERRSCNIPKFYSIWRPPDACKFVQILTESSESAGEGEVPESEVVNRVGQVGGGHRHRRRRPVGLPRRARL